MANHSVGHACCLHDFKTKHVAKKTNRRWHVKDLHSTHFNTRVMQHGRPQTAAPTVGRLIL